MCCNPGSLAQRVPTARLAPRCLPWSQYLSGRCCSSVPVTYSPVTLLPKELSFFGRQPEREIEREQFLNQPNEESLEAIAKELETELEQEKMHLLQAKKEKIQQFQEEMRQQEHEEAQKLHQQKEESLRYFPFLVHLPRFSREPLPAVCSLLVLLLAPALLRVKQMVDAQGCVPCPSSRVLEVLQLENAPLGQAQLLGAHL